MIRIDDINDKIVDFQTLPSIYTKLLEKMSDANSTIEDIAKIISADPTATIKILKTVNSAIFGIPKKIDTISEAIFHIGFNEVKNLVLALSIINIFSQIKSIKDLNIIDLWKHSIATGVINRIIAQRLNIRNIENYYIIGLLHDLGKYFYLKEFPSEYNSVIRMTFEKGWTISQAEIEYFSIDHSEVGSKLAEKWNLPDVLIKSIKSHNNIEINGEYAQEINCVYISNITAKIFNWGVLPFEKIPKPDTRVWQLLNFKAGYFRELFPKIYTEFEQIYNLLLVER